MHALAESLAQTIVGVAKEYPELRVVYLFGSHAQGRARPDSDVDVAVVTAADSDPLLDLRLADRLSAAVHASVDVVALGKVSPTGWW
jgi:predicted nucleotidyltransferase